MSDCIFCKIIAGSIPCSMVYEDDEFIAFHDIRPIAKVHLLVVPKQHKTSLLEYTQADQALLGRLLLLAPKLAAEHGLVDGFKTSINTGPGGGQEVPHLHIHVHGGGRPH